MTDARGTMLDPPNSTPPIVVLGRVDGAISDCVDSVGVGKPPLTPARVFDDAVGVGRADLFDSRNPANQTTTPMPASTTSAPTPALIQVCVLQDFTKTCLRLENDSTAHCREAGAARPRRADCNSVHEAS